MYKSCVDAEKKLQMLQEDIKSGMPLTTAMKAEVVHEYEFCKLMRSREFWKTYHTEVLGATYPDAEMHSEDHEMRLSDKELEDWVAGMWHTANGAKHMGAHWNMQQTTAVGKQYGVDMTDLTEMEFWAVLNAMWHDHYRSAVIAEMTGEARFFVELAKDFLFDEDSGKKPYERIYCYFHYMA